MEDFISSHKIDKEKEKSLWENATFIFDTSALLNFFYIISEKTRDSILSNLKDKKSILKINSKINNIYKLYDERIELYKRYSDIIIENNGTLQEVTDRTAEEIEKIFTK